MSSIYSETQQTSGKAKNGLPLEKPTLQRRNKCSTKKGVMVATARKCQGIDLDCCEIIAEIVPNRAAAMDRDRIVACAEHESSPAMGIDGRAFASVHRKGRATTHLGSCTAFKTVRPHEFYRIFVDTNTLVRLSSPRRTLDGMRMRRLRRKLRARDNEATINSQPARIFPGKLDAREGTCALEVLAE
ncbi:hypothetical protein B0H13DRAFT_1891454 [Mycena leptocephala]|nr:hypothetical protein B0H13DRAFT_1891454 [Mycena leptocephala]